MQQQFKEFQELEENFAAYHLFMVCCHPNGVSYEIIKERLPYINQEISKILTNIVDFEVFISNNEDKLDIFIKHPSHDPRPLEMGSGAEKTIASMAIRLAFLTVSSLPKSDLFILDEPTTGLHFADIELLLGVLERLKNQGNTVVVIEHNLDVIKTADWIIDLGPEGGSDGGEIVAEGTPEDVAKVKKSFTGKFLKDVLG